MRHTLLVIHRLLVDGEDMALRHGTLVVVERDCADRLDWEVVADGVEEYAGGLGGHLIEMLCITGANDDGHLILAELSGRAVVVRFTERTVVLRGDGPLTGFDVSLFYR